MEKYTLYKYYDKKEKLENKFSQNQRKKNGNFNDDYEDNQNLIWNHSFLDNCQEPCNSGQLSIGFLKAIPRAKQILSLLLQIMTRLNTKKQDD